MDRKKIAVVSIMYFWLPEEKGPSRFFYIANMLGEMGYDIQFAPVDTDGVVDIDALKALLTDKTILVSVMTVNNETGSIQPIERIAKLVHKSCPDALFHTDAVQAYGKIPLKPKKLGVDLMSISAHKIHGAKGCGALYIRDGARILPLLYGGEQQHKVRPGTESAPLIAAFGAAAAAAFPDLSHHTEHINKLNTYALEKLKQLDGVTVNSSLTSPSRGFGRKRCCTIWRVRAFTSAPRARAPKADAAMFWRLWGCRMTG